MVIAVLILHTHKKVKKKIRAPEEEAPLSEFSLLKLTSTIDIFRHIWNNIQYDV